MKLKTYNVYYACNCPPFGLRRELLNAEIKGHNKKEVLKIVRKKINVIFRISLKAAKK